MSKQKKNDNAKGGEVVDKVKNNSDIKGGEKLTLIGRRRTFSGPIPPPDLLEKYEDLYPGCAKEIVKSGLSQVSHQQKIENKKVAIFKDLSEKGLTIGYKSLNNLLIVLGLSLCVDFVNAIIQNVDFNISIITIGSGGLIGLISIIRIVLSYLNSPNKKNVNHRKEDNINDLMNLHLLKEEGIISEEEYEEKSRKHKDQL